ncbi:RND transporter [Methylovirgula ligni]|uniref:NodT family efflux transporter outer membrane factor (OMF) lipoprotein n=1 Tax=Methylovirgula ligni TaxID=569860 RepID=A0A3D9YVS9_9HYPH|nr:efflux transporter outer membrane subunit [Methylovirgula ligni]QAY96020.1 RND transporter [Methylovirgula ligni]REF86308.1 NodT family efflux transporter outer membrane factor (OMF) lipoprotein [Methylovirgula ligni]
MRYAWGVVASFGLLLTGCMVGPDYIIPAVPVTPKFKEARTPADPKTAGIWIRATPSDALARGKWWEVFGDPELNRLEAQLGDANQSLKEAEARFAQSRALIRVARAAEFPSVSAGSSAAYIRESAHQPYVTFPNPPALGDFQMPVDLNYEIDFWGSVHRSVEAAREEAQATAADLSTASLSLHAELALDYIALRAQDAQQRLLDETVKAYAHALQLTTNRHVGGLAPESDVEQAQTQLATTKVQDTDVGVARAQYEHAIAVLIGEPPAALTIPAASFGQLKPRLIPAVLPSELLQRRPDIAAAERRVAEANQQIGIADAAFYPNVNLAALAGFQGTTPANWFLWPSLLWSVGTTLSQPIFDGGAIRAQSDAVRAAYAGDVATYRQTTLSAFQDVEDNLSALRILGKEAKQQRDAVIAANRALDTFTKAYTGGEVAYLQVITAQTAALSNEVNQVDIERRRLEANVRLVKALGGGWDTGLLPVLASSGLPRGAFVPVGQQ